jgi:zinc protease
MWGMTSGALTRLGYPIVQHTLGNGLRVISSPDHIAPSVAINIWYDVGSRDEEEGRTGFAHLFEHVMFQGSAHVASGQHIALLQAAGAVVNATTWFDRTNYFETLPTGGLDLALWLEADRMGTLLDALTQQNLDNQREVVKEEKRQRYDNVPYGDVQELLDTLTFPPDHPYGHITIGSMEDLDAATLDDVHSFFRRHYLPNNAILSIVGDVDPDISHRATSRQNRKPNRWNRYPEPRVPRPPARCLPTRSISRGGYLPEAAGISMRSTSPSAFLAMARPRGCTNNWCVAMSTPRAPGLQRWA